MPQHAATIGSLPMAFALGKEMQADGLERGEGYRPLGRLALAEIIEGRMDLEAAIGVGPAHRREKRLRRRTQPGRAGAAQEALDGGDRGASFEHRRAGIVGLGEAAGRHQHGQAVARRHRAQHQPLAVDMALDAVGHGDLAAQEPGSLRTCRARGRRVWSGAPARRRLPEIVAIHACRGQVRRAGATIQQ